MDKIQRRKIQFYLDKHTNEEEQSRISFDEESDQNYASNEIISSHNTDTDQHQVQDIESACSSDEESFSHDCSMNLSTSFLY